MQVSRDQLVEDSVFILQCLRQNARGGRQNALEELEGSVALEPADYVAFLERFGYVKVEEREIRVTPQGERAAKGDADVSVHVQDHFKQVIDGPRSDTQPQIPVPAVKPVDAELGQGPLSRVQVELGDARYRAPEVSASEPAGTAADAFALGTLLHEMLAGASDGAFPADLPAPLVELLDELRHPDQAKRPVLAAAATRLARLLAPHPLFAL